MKVYFESFLQKEKKKKKKNLLKNFDKFCEDS